MAKSQETYNKKEKEKKRLKKRQEKLKRQEERNAAAEANAEAGISGFDSMIAYVDENGNITDTPPDLTKKKKVNAKSIEIGVPRREKEEVDAVRKGRVEFFNDSKGFGFIKEHDTHEKYFVHVNGLLEEIRENDMVTFELERGMKGMNAVRVKKA